MAHRPLRTTDFSDQLALWEETECPEREAPAVPETDGSQPADLAPPAPRRPAAARRTDAVARSERALAAIRAMLAIHAGGAR